RIPSQATSTAQAVTAAAKGCQWVNPKGALLSLPATHMPSETHAVDVRGSKTPWVSRGGTGFRKHGRRACGTASSLTGSGRDSRMNVTVDPVQGCSHAFVLSELSRRSRSGRIVTSGGGSLRRVWIQLPHRHGGHGQPQPVRAPGPA